MIFVTVGSQLPFDRLIKTIDEWAANQPNQAVFAQIGDSKYTPQHIEFCKKIDPTDFHKRMEDADLLIAHAGMGTIITALELGKPLLLMPRLAEKGEHRNNHQLATIKRFSSFSNIKIAMNEQELGLILSTLIQENAGTIYKTETKVSEELVTAIKNFVLDC